MAKMKIISSSPPLPVPGKGAAPKKKLIEVALPLEAINKASVRESYIYRGNPSAIHKWWAQRPLAVARAVIFAQMVDDPSGHPDLFPTERKREKERQRLFRIIEDLVLWESTTDKKVLDKAREEIWQSWRYTCAENADHSRAKELFDRYKLPPFSDPFAGGGTLPLEAQRLGLESHASDLNPVAVLINKSLIEIPPKFSSKPPVSPEARREKSLLAREWHDTQGIAEDVRHYGKWLRNEAAKHIGHLYPEVEVTQEMAKSRPDLKPDVGKQLTAIAWLWARTVKSPNPAFATVDVPLASTFLLSTRSGKEAYVKPLIEKGNYRFTVKLGRPSDVDGTKNGTKLAGANFRCLMSGAPISGSYIRAEAKAGRLGQRLMAIVAIGDNGRVYLEPSEAAEAAAKQAKPKWIPEVEFLQQALGFRVGNYGMSKWSDLFTPRQLIALTTFADLVKVAHELALRDAITAGLTDDDKPLVTQGTGATAYADAVAAYLALSLSKAADYNCTLVPWYTKEDRPGHLFSKQTVPMVWDYAELNPLSDIGGSLAASIRIVADALGGCYSSGIPGNVTQAGALSLQLSRRAVISTDPPYYDNIGYADLSDFFYVWLRRALKPFFPSLFSTVEVPKSEELVATPHRHGGKEEAEAFFVHGMTQAMRQLVEHTHPAFPVTIYYAFKQSETESNGESGTTSTGWDTFLEAVIRAGFTITGTWPLRTERGSRSRGIGSNALASSILLACRPRSVDSPTASRREFVNALKAELPAALAHLQRGNIAPVDLAQSAIGPGMAIYTRYTKVLDAEGKPLSVRDALALINQILDETLAEQEGDFEADSRWALAWFEQHGFSEGEYGIAEILSKAKDTSVQGLKDAGILDKKSPGGKVRLLRPSELSTTWDPATDPRLTAWEMVHQLIRVLEAGGESEASALVAKLGTKAEIARELCYRLYTICERKKRAAEALSYNSLVQSWPEITRLARETGRPQEAQHGLFDPAEE